MARPVSRWPLRGWYGDIPGSCALTYRLTSKNWLAFLILCELCVDDLIIVGWWNLMWCDYEVYSDKWINALCCFDSDVSFERWFMFALYKLIYMLLVVYMFVLWDDPACVYPIQWIWYSLIADFTKMWSMVCKVRSTLPIYVRVWTLIGDQR